MSVTISVVTPAFNSRDYIEQTIQSVLSQSHHPLEHIVIDGGSTDGTVDILRRYSHLKWMSEPDEGQTDALNKGFRLAQGDIVCWLNADDMYAPGALGAVARFFEENPTVDLAHGDIEYVDAQGRSLYYARGREFEAADVLLSNPINQQAAFFRRKAFDIVGYLRADLEYIMDYEFWLRLGWRVESRYVPELWAYYRFVPGTKTVEYPERFWLEALQIFGEIFADPVTPPVARQIERLAYARMHWLAGTGLYRAGRQEEAREHCMRALQDYGLLAQDSDFAVDACRYIESHYSRLPNDEEWIKYLVDDLSGETGNDDGFVNRVRALFYATRAYFHASRSNWQSVRRDTVRALWYDLARWGRNRGFLSQGMESLAGQRVMRVARRLYAGIISR